MSNICSRHSITEWARCTRMEEEIKTRGVSRSIPESRPLCCSCPEPTNGSCVATVSHQVYDFFETVQAKSTDLDAPDPEWKYISGFVTKKGPTKEGAKGGLDSVLVPCRGATAATIPPQEHTGNDRSSDLQQDPPLPSENNDDEPNQPASQQPVTPPALPQPQQEHPTVAAHQTCSSRVIKNTPATTKAFPFVTKVLSFGNFSLIQRNKKTAPQPLRNSPYKRPSKIQSPTQQQTILTFFIGTR